MVRLSERAQNMPASPIRRLVPFADQAKANGRHVHQLNIGQPDVATPRGMIEAYRSFNEKVLAYGPSQGFPELRKKVADYYAQLGNPVPQEFVQVTFGGSEALQFALSALAEPGDDFLVPEPFYANYAGFATQLAVRLTPVPSTSADGFHLPLDADFEAKLGPRTRGVIVSSPGNPTGTVYRRDEMERVGRFVEKHDLALLSDEVYREFAYDGVEVTSALSLSCADERVVVTDSVSKRFSACGARVGFILTRNPVLAEVFMKMCFSRLCPATVDQIAAIAAYDTPKSYFEDVVAEYQRRRNALVDGLNAIPGVSSPRPEGAFYTIATFPVQDIDDFATWLLRDFEYNNETVQLAPATGFYGTPGMGFNQARIAYVLEVPALLRAVDVLRYGLDAYPGPKL